MNETFAQFEPGLLGFAGAFLATSVLLPLALPIYRQLGLVDKPNARSAHRQPTPRGVGLVVVCGFWLSLLATAFWRGSACLPAAGELTSAWRVGCLLAASFLLVGTGLVDDVLRVRAVAKLGVQLTCAALLVSAGFVWPLPEFFGSLQSAFEIATTLLWIVGVINAVNFVDGSDGYCTTLSTLCILVFVGLSFMIPPGFSGGEGSSQVIQTLGLAAAGSALPFLFFNLAPARCFLGDTGSMFFGFLLAVLGICTAQYARADLSLGPEAAAVATDYRFLFLPWMVLFVPIVDAVRVALGRVKSGRSPFAPDNTHLHHVFQRWGLSPNQMVVAVLLIGITSGLFAVHLLVGAISGALIVGVAFTTVLSLLWFLRCSYRARRALAELMNRRLLGEDNVPPAYNSAGAFREQAEQEIARSRRRGLAASVCVVTLRGRALDAPGASPLANPRFLEGLLQMLRLEDIKGRFSADQLAFILIEADRCIATEISQRIYERFNGIRTGESQGLQFGVGFGTFPEDADNFAELLTLAEQAAVEHLESGAPWPDRARSQAAVLDV